MDIEQEKQGDLFGGGKLKTKMIQVKLPHTIVTALDKYCETTGEKRSVVILQALKAYLH